MSHNLQLIRSGRDNGSIFSTAGYQIAIEPAGQHQIAGQLLPWTAHSILVKAGRPMQVAALWAQILALTAWDSSSRLYSSRLAHLLKDADSQQKAEQSVSEDRA